MGKAVKSIGRSTGKFFGINKSAPMQEMTHYTPQQAVQEKPAVESFKPINAMQWMDTISGEQFSFVRDRNGNLNVQTRDISGKPGFDSPIAINNINTNLPDLGNLPNIRLPDVNNLPDVNLPEVGNLPEFTNRYAAAVANLTGRMRDLQNTIRIMEMTAPELIPQNAPIINAFKAASQRAMDKGFDIYKNGLDKKLAQMGLTNSSTALGSQIALARERTDAEINNALQVAQLGHSTKQQTVANAFQLGQQLVQEGSIELNKYNSESQNELTARGQNLDREKVVQQRALGREQLIQNSALAKEQLIQNSALAREQLIQQRALANEGLAQNKASEKIRFDFAQEQMRINSELATRQLGAAERQSRNPTNAAVNLLNQGNNTALQAIQGDNVALHNRNIAELGLGQNRLSGFNINEAHSRNPALEIMGQLGGNYFANQLAGNANNGGAGNIVAPKGKRLN